MTWQPIETAPRDGTEVLLALKGKHRACLGYWIDSEDVRYGKSVRKRQLWSVESMWILHGDEPEPTHWMPLPELPPPSSTVSPDFSEGETNSVSS